MSKTYHVTMDITIDESASESLQRITHHIEELVDLDNWPEIKTIAHVTCQEQN